MIWLVDHVGNNGKTLLSYYLQDMCNALRVPNANSNDYAFAYKNQQVVVFDYTGVSKDHINYDLLKDLKNGSLWSPKYQSVVKSWRTNVKVVCFANPPPLLPRRPQPSRTMESLFHFSPGSEWCLGA